MLIQHFGIDLCFYRYSNTSDDDLIKISYVAVNNIDISAVSSMVIEIIP